MAHPNGMLDPDDQKNMDPKLWPNNTDAGPLPPYTGPPRISPSGPHEATHSPTRGRMSKITHEFVEFFKTPAGKACLGALLVFGLICLIVCLWRCKRRWNRRRKRNERRKQEERAIQQMIKERQTEEKLALRREKKRQKQRQYDLERQKRIQHLEDLHRQQKQRKKKDIKRKRPRRTFKEVLPQLRKLATDSTPTTSESYDSHERTEGKNAFFYQG